MECQRQNKNASFHVYVLQKSLISLNLGVQICALAITVVFMSIFISTDKLCMPVPYNLLR